MSSEKEPVLVSRNEKRKLIRLLVCLAPGILLAKLLSPVLSRLAVNALLLLWPVLSGWLLMFIPLHTVEVRERQLLYRQAIISKEKTIPYAEIREAHCVGASLLRYLVLTDDEGKAIIRLEADMNNLDRLVDTLKEKHIPVNDKKERN